MAVETKITTAQQVSDLRKSIGQSDKKILNSSQEFVSVPKEGTFSRIGSKEFDIPGTGKVTSIGFFTTNDKFVAENTIFASTVTEQVVEVKNGPNKGKFMLRQERVSPELFDLADSQDKRLLALIGKSFTTERVSGFQLKDFAANKMFAKTEAQKASLKDNREAKTYHKFSL